MAQVTGPLTINDGAAVAKSFAPERVSPGESIFLERSAAVSAGFTKLAVNYSSANSRRPTNRIDLKLDYPVLQVVDGVNKVAYTGRFQGYFVVPDSMTSTERANLQAFVANALANATVKAVVKDLDPMY